MVKIVVSGALGRMGMRIMELARQDCDLKVIAGLEFKSGSDPNIVTDLKAVKDAYDCVIEFTSPKATTQHVETAKRLKKAMVIGTTGLSEKDIALVKEASKTIPIVLSPNMSVGVNVLFNLIKRSAHVLGKDYKVKIKEAHHVHKKDKPSGTAKLMADIVKENAPNSVIPIQAIREDEIVGDHDIIFESGVDVLRISHSAKTRDIFALGALKAAKFLAGKKKGLFSMSDVLGL